MNNKNKDIKSGITMGSDYWISFTDIMTGLLFIFILIILLLMFKYQKMMTQKEVLDSLTKDKIDLIAQLQDLQSKNTKLESKNAELESKNKELQKSLDEAKSQNTELLAKNEKLVNFQQELEKYETDWYEGYKSDQEILKLLRKLRDELNNVYNINVQLDETNKTLNIDSNVIGFKTKEYEIQNKQEYKDAIAIISNILKREIDKDQRYIDAIFIEGYTDDVPFDKKATFGNWGLSALRAISFWDSLNKSLVNHGQSDLTKIKSADGKKFLFSVSGYANVRPINCKDFEYHHTCELYQHCVLIKNVDNPQKCLSDNDLKFSDVFLDKYNTKNRRIGIRFIPYHKVGAEK